MYAYILIEPQLCHCSPSHKRPMRKGVKITDPFQAFRVLRTRRNLQKSQVHYVLMAVFIWLCLGVHRAVGPICTSVIEYFLPHDPPRSKTILSPDFFYVDLISQLEGTCQCGAQGWPDRLHRCRGPWARTAILDNDSNLISRQWRKLLGKDLKPSRAQPQSLLNCSSSELEGPQAVCSCFGCS